MDKPILSPIQTIIPLTLQGYERYLPTAFDESLTLLQKVNKIINELNKMGDVSNDILEQWNKIIEWLNDLDIDSMVDSVLNQWLLDGTLFAHISVINALIFDADNTGTRGTAADLQRAIDFIKTMGGGTLYIPAGTYLIDDKLTLCDNITIQMDKGTVLKRAWAGGFFQNGAWDDLNNVNMNGTDNITIIGGVLDGNYSGLAQYPATTCDMIAFGYADNFTVRDTTFLDVLSYHAIDLNGMTNVLIENCQFKGYVNIINTSIPREAIQIGEAQVYADARDTYAPCKNITVRKCYFGASGLSPAFPVSVGNHYSRYNVYNEHITIEDNTIVGCTSYGIRPFKWKDVAILNNTILDCEVGIQISNPSGDIESSKDVNGTQTGLPQAGFDYLIDGNTIKNFNTYGVYSTGQLYNGVMAKPKNIKVVNNEFTGTASNQTNNAISFMYAENIKVANNYFKDTARGLVVRGCKFIDYIFNKNENMYTEAAYSQASGLTDVNADGYYNEHFNIHYNEVNGTQKNGFYMQNAKDFKISDNDIISPSQLNDGVNRGGVFCDTSIGGRITNNNTVGSSVEFNINVNAGCNDIVTHNNSGVGQIQLLGTNCVNGFYGIDGSGNIVFKPQ